MTRPTGCSRQTAATFVPSNVSSICVPSTSSYPSTPVERNVRSASAPARSTVVVGAAPVVDGAGGARCPPNGRSRSTPLRRWQVRTGRRPVRRRRHRTRRAGRRRVPGGRGHDGCSSGSDVTGRGTRSRATPISEHVFDSVIELVYDEVMDGGVDTEPGDRGSVACGVRPSQRAQRPARRARRRSARDRGVARLGGQVVGPLVDLAGRDLAAAGPSEVVRLAEARATHPAVMSTFAAGALSVDQAAIATRRLPTSTTSSPSWPPSATVAQLRTMVRAARPAPPHRPRPMTPGRVVDRLVRRRRPLPPARRARRRPRSHRRRRPHRSPRRPVPGRSTATCHGPTPSSRWPNAPSTRAPAERRERFRVNWFIDPIDPVPAQWTDGIAVPDWLRHLLSCDGTVAPTFTDGARPVSVGRTQHQSPTAPAASSCTATRSVGSRGAPRPAGCRSTTSCTAKTAAPTDTSNLIALCPADHRLHHRRLLGITGNADHPDGLTFTDAHGRVIDPAAHPTKPTGPPPEPRPALPAPDRRTNQPRAILFPDPPADEGTRHDPPRRHDVMTMSVGRVAVSCSTTPLGCALLNIALGASLPSGTISACVTTERDDHVLGPVSVHVIVAIEDVRPCGVDRSCPDITLVVRNGQALVGPGVGELLVRAS